MNVNALTKSAAQPNKRRLSVTGFFRAYWIPTLFLLPAILFLGMFFVYPAFNSIWMSLNKINLMTGSFKFTGFKNYADALSSEVFRITTLNTLAYVVMATIPLVLLGFITALLIDNSRFMRNVMKGLVYTPAIISMSIAGLMWKLLLTPIIGAVDIALTNLGIHGPNWLADPRYALVAVTVVGIWRGLGMNTILFMAGLKGMPKEQLEAASVDGATPVQSILYIIIPSITYTITFVLITTVISCFQVFAIIRIMTEGGPNNATNMMVYQIWQEGFRFFNMGGASAMSTILFIFLFALSLVLMRFMDTGSESDLS